MTWAVSVSAVDPERRIPSTLIDSRKLTEVRCGRWVREAVQPGKPLNSPHFRIDGRDRGHHSARSVDLGLATDWHDCAAAEGPILLRHAVQVKNIWIPYGE